MSDDEPTSGEVSENGEGAAPARKRTRRGSRGGRNRKRKPPATADGETGALATAEPGPADGPRDAGEADAYVPMSEWIDELDE